MPPRSFVDAESDIDGDDGSYSRAGPGSAATRSLQRSLLARSTASTDPYASVGVIAMVNAASPRFSAQRLVLVIVVWAGLMLVAVVMVIAVRPASSSTDALASSTLVPASPHPFIPSHATPALVEIPTAAGKKPGNGRKGAGTELEVAPSLALFHTATAIANGSLTHKDPPHSQSVPVTPSVPEVTGESAAPSRKREKKIHSGFTDDLARRASLPSEQESSSGASHTAAPGAASVSAQRAASGAVAEHYRSVLCSWWSGNRAAALSLIQQALGDVVNLVLTLNFQHTVDRTAYIDQLEHWRASHARKAESPARLAAGHDCRRVCAPVPAVPASASGAGSAAGVSAANTFRQKLIECIICETAQIELSGRCEAKDAGVELPDSPVDPLDTAPPLDTDATTGPSDPEALRAAFDGILGDKAVRNVGGRYGHARGPFFLAAPLERTFETFFSLFSTFAYSPTHLRSFFPLPSRKVEVSVPRTRAHTRWLAALQHDALQPAAHAALGLPYEGNATAPANRGKGAAKLETTTLGSAGLGGGLGVQLMCRPSPDVAPVVILSAGGGGGRGYSLALATADDAARRTRKRLSHERAGAAAAAGGAGAAADAVKERGTLESLPFRATRRAHFSAGGGGGLQVSAAPFGPPASLASAAGDSGSSGAKSSSGKRSASSSGVVKDSLGRDATWLAVHDSDNGSSGNHDSSGSDMWDLIAGGGGGGSVTITDDAYTEAHGSQHDADTHLPFFNPATPSPEAEAAGVDELRLGLYSSLRDCLLHGPDAELVIAGGGGAGTGAQMTALARPLPSSGAEQPLASALFNAELGFAFTLPIPHAWFSPAPSPAVRARSVHAPHPSHSTEAGAGGASDPQAGRADDLAAALSADAEARLRTMGPMWGAQGGAGGSGKAAAPNPTLGSLKRLELTRFTPLGEDPYALSAVAAVCVASCVASSAADATPAAVTSSSDSVSVAAAGASGRGLGGGQFPELLSTSTASTTSLFYAHCVCPCLQRHLPTRPWAGYLACRDQAVGTLDRASAGHVASAVDADDERAEKEVAEIVAAAQGKRTSAEAQNAQQGQVRKAGRIENPAWGNVDEEERAWAPIKVAEGEHVAPVRRNRNG